MSTEEEIREEMRKRILEERLYGPRSGPPEATQDQPAIHHSPVPAYVVDLREELREVKEKLSTLEEIQFEQTKVVQSCLESMNKLNSSWNTFKTSWFEMISGEE